MAFLKSVWIIALLAGLLTGRLLAQSDELTYKAYLSDKDISETKLLWRKAVVSRQAEFDKNPDSKDAGYRLALSELGLLGSTFAIKTKPCLMSTSARPDYPPPLKERAKIEVQIEPRA